MIPNLYFLALLITLGDIAYLTHKKDRHVDRYLWTIVTLIPIIILGYWLKTTVHTAEAAMVSFCFIYLDSTILLTIVLFSILSSINVQVPKWIKAATYGVTFFHLMTIWLSKDNKLYYTSMTLYDTGVGIATKMTSGPLKITHYIYLGLIVLAIFVALIIGFIRKSTYSKKSLRIYTIFGIAGVFIYIYETLADVNFSMLPGLYTLGSLIITLGYDSFQCHSLNTIIGEKQAKTALKGFAIFDKRKRILGYNEEFVKIFPEAINVIIDTRVDSKSQTVADFLYPLLDRCKEQGDYVDNIYFNERIYTVTVSSFDINDEDQIDGYFIELKDITEEKKRVELIEKYNERLGQDVKEKTEHIVDIQNSVVLGLANLVENRDDNTGGHIKRTSNIIKFLVREAIRRGVYNIDEQKAADIIRAAPMHDLGKISIEKNILCKPGRLTEEEYAIMKTHAPKSGEIVHIILDGVEEEHFVNTAFNVARHHHERWDGKGYPDGLMGEDIPVEARIMAVADVYDALVSKRCYKEPMDFKTAAKIMNENMGTQFDPAMRPVFNACLMYLQEYYSTIL